MPLAYEGRAVARPLQQLGHGLLRAVEDAVLVVGEPVLVAVLAGEHACARWPRERVGHEAAREAHAVGGYAVQVWRLHVARVVARHHLRRVVVGHYIYYVWPLGLLCHGGYARHGHDDELRCAFHRREVYGIKFSAHLWCKDKS